MKRISERVGSTVVALLMSCASPSGVLPDGGAPRSPPVSYGTAATDLVLLYSAGGEMSGRGFGWTHIPELALYGDGRVFRATRPANPSYRELQESRIPAEELQRTVDLAASLGLLDGCTVQPATVSDSNTFELRVFAGGRAVRHRFESTLALPPESAVARLLANVQARLASPDAGLSWSPLRFQAVRLRGSPGPSQCDGGVPWSFGADPNACVAVDADAGAYLEAALEPDIDHGLAGPAGACVAFTYRPLLPGEDDCAQPRAAECP